MKKLRCLLTLLLIMCVVGVFSGNVNAADIVINRVSSTSKLITEGVDPNYRTVNSGKHEIVLEQNLSNMGNFIFYKNGDPDRFNNHFENGVKTYIIPNEKKNNGLGDPNYDERYNYSTKFSGDEEFVVRYKKVMYHINEDKTRTYVDCILTIKPRGDGNGDPNPVSVNFTEYGAVGFYDNFYKGLTLFDTKGADIEYEFVWADTYTNIGRNVMWWLWGSVNSYEGISSNNASTEYYLTAANYTQTTVTDFSSTDNLTKAKASIDKYWPRTGSKDDLVWGVGLDNQNSSDKYGASDFDKTIVGMKVQTSDGKYKFRTLSHDFWFCPSLAPFGATAETPEKTVKKKADSVWSDGIEVFVGESIQYKFDQTVEDITEGGNGYYKYNSFVMKDVLPKEVEYVSARVVDQNGNNITNQGTLRYDKASHTVTFTFSYNYLQNGMQYVGETYSLIIDCVVDSDSVENVPFDNTPISIINQTEIVGNKVPVTPHYKYARITVDKVDAETGKTTQGDAKFVNAEYSLYSDSACTKLLETLVLDENGTKISKDYVVEGYRDGKHTYTEDFYIKETKTPEGYLIDGNVYHVHIDRNDITDVKNNVKNVGITSEDRVKKNDIEIIKYLEETDSTEKQNLAGAVFSATLISSIGTEDPLVYYSTETDENGYCKFTDLPYGRYRIQETTIPDLAYNGEFYLNDETERRTTFDVYVEKDKTEREAYRYEVTDVAKKMKITIYKEDIETGVITQGDATLAGAEYTLYRDEGLTDAIETITIQKDEENGTWHAESGWYLSGTYYIKETKAPEGYLIDERVYTVTQEPAEQTTEFSYHSITSKELVIKGDIHIIKFLNQANTTDEDPAAGCKVYLTLDSSVNTGNPKVYEATINKDGYAEWLDIPYGWYTITESEEARENGFKLMDPEGVYVEKDREQYYRIVGENPIYTLVRVEKQDKDTGKVIPIAGVKYKIWSYKDNEYVEQVTAEGRITEFKTNDFGYFITPQKLEVGKYKLVELDPPYGYHNEDLEFEVEDGVYENKEEVPVVNVYQKDEMQKGKIQISKTAEVLVGTRQTADEETGLEVVTPIYETRGLEGVTYKVTATEDIKTGDGKIQMAKGESINIVTDEQGVASTPELYLGTYTVEEIDTVTGYILNDKIETITLDYRTEGRDEEGRLIVSRNYTVSREYVNERVPYKLEFEKKYGTIQYNNADEEAKNRVRFGLYTAEDIKGYQSENVLIKKDTLLEVIAVENGKAEASADLPVGKYYIKELETDVPYEIDETKYEFTFKPSITSNMQVIEINDGEAINNEPSQGELNFLKVSRKVYEANKQLIDRIIANKDVEGFKEFAKENGLLGAKYEVYFKNDKGEYKKLQALKEDNTWEDVVFVSGEDGTDVKELPYGTYYLKEIEAPEEHEIDPNYIEVKVSSELNITVVEDPKKQGEITVIHKDVDTDEEIYDREHSEDDIGEPYTTTERTEEINDMLDLDFDSYELVEEKYPENAEGYYDKEEQVIVYYYRKVMSKVTVKYLDVETLEEISYGYKYIDYIGKDYTTFAKEIPGYELVVEMYPTNAEGQYEREAIEVIYYYRKLPVDTSDINIAAIIGIITISLAGIVVVSKRKSLN